MDFRKTARPLFAYVIVFIMAVFFASSSVLAQEKTEEERKAEAVERELRRRYDEDQREASLRTLNQLAAKVDKTAELYATLLERAAAFSERMKALLTNEEGKRIAYDPAGFMSYLDLEKYPAASIDEIKAKQAATASMLKELKSQQERIDVGYVPRETTVDEAVGLYFWVTDRLARLTAQEERLQTALAKAPPSIDLTKSKTLADAITDYHARWYDLLGSSRILGEQLSKPQTEQILINAARAAQLERAEAERDRLIGEQRIEIERLKLDFDVKLLQMTKEQEARRIKAEQEFEDAKTELEGLRKDAELARRARTIDAEIARDSKTSEAEKKLLVQRCQSAEVKRVLAPFLSEGYWQPGSNERGIYKMPVSLAALRRIGALEPNKSGLAALLAIGVGKDYHGNRRFNDRGTLWGWHHRIDNISTAQLEALKKAQQTLNELGETMVELKMLAR